MRRANIRSGCSQLLSSNSRPIPNDRVVVAPELADGARIYHLRSRTRRARTCSGAVGTPRHLVLYRALEPDLIGIARILHDSMDFPAHATDDFGEG